MGDVLELKRGYDLPQKDRLPGMIPLVSSSGVTDHHAVPMAKGPGVVTGRYGTLGQVFFIREDFWPLNTTLYVRDFKGNDPRFISYFLKTLDFLAYSDKAAVPGLNRNHLHEAVVRIPTDTGEQRAIAHILGTLDDRIELNWKMNETLEAMARALFQSWFVDFDPVRAKAEGRDPGLPQPLAGLFPDSFEESELAEIPRGWEVKSLDEIAAYLNGLALQKYPPEDDNWLPVIKIAQIRAGNSSGADRASTNIPPAYVVQDGDVLFSWSGSLEVEIWSGGSGALNQHLFKVSSSEFPKWFYYFWTREHLPEFRSIAAGKATTMGHIQRGHLTAAKALVPPEPLLDSMDQVMSPLLDRVLGMRLQSRTLAALRDSLLPKLISGELRVADAERFLARAGAL